MRLRYKNSILIRLVFLQNLVKLCVSLVVIIHQNVNLYLNHLLGRMNTNCCQSFLLFWNSIHELSCVDIISKNLIYHIRVGDESFRVSNYLPWSIWEIKNHEKYLIKIRWRCGNLVIIRHIHHWRCCVRYLVSIHLRMISMDHKWEEYFGSNEI